MPEYAGQGMERVRRGGGKARERFTFRITVKGTGLRSAGSSEELTQHPRTKRWGIYPLPPTPWTRPPRGVDCPQPHFQAATDSSLSWLQLPGRKPYSRKWRDACHPGGRMHSHPCKQMHNCLTQQQPESEVVRQEATRADQRGCDTSVHIKNQNPRLLRPPHDFVWPLWRAVSHIFPNEKCTYHLIKKFRFQRFYILTPVWKVVCTVFIEALFAMASKLEEKNQYQSPWDQSNK